MYRNLVPNIVKSKQRMANGVRAREHEIDTDVITHHLDLLCHRNKKMTVIDDNTLIGFQTPKPKSSKFTSKFKL